MFFSDLSIIYGVQDFGEVLSKLFLCKNVMDFAFSEKVTIAMESRDRRQSKKCEIILSFFKHYNCNKL